MRKLFLFVLLAFCAGAQAQIFEGRQLVDASLLADVDAIVPGQKFAVGLRLVAQAGWHTYWQYPGDSGMATRIDWQLPPSFRAGEIQWPVPQKIVEEGDLWTYAYPGEVLLLVELTAPEKIAETSITLHAHPHWLVCEKTCVPGDAELTLTLPVAQTAKPANTELFAKYSAQLPRQIPAAAAAHVVWSRENSSLLLDTGGALQSEPAEFFPLPPEGVVVGHPELDKTIANVTRVRIPISSEEKPVAQIAGVITTVAGEHWLLANPAAEPVRAESTADHRSLITWLFLGFVGGMILNIMPCVLPVIALKILGFVQQAGKSRARILELGLAFIAGIFVWFLALAALLVAFKSAGREVNWALQFGNPWFVLGMFIFVLVFALNLLGIFELVLPARAHAGLGRLIENDGLGGAFFHGVFATLLGSACTAPLLGPALGFAVTQPPAIIFAMFAAIAAGMALPYFLLTAQPAWLRFLPKPGMWMVRVKQAMGVLMLVTAIWLGWVFWQQQTKKIEPFAPQLARALQQGRVVFVDFTADWCINCKVNERLVLNTDTVQRALHDHDVLFLKADWTRQDADITGLLKKFGRAGVPLYVVFPPHGEPIVLPEVITTQIVTEAIERAALR